MMVIYIVTDQSCRKPAGLFAFIPPAEITSVCADAHTQLEDHLMVDCYLKMKKGMLIYCQKMPAEI